MPGSDLALLTEAAEEAGRIAVKYWGKSPETWDKGGGAGPVTEADLAVDAMLKSELLAARPDYGWLSEETEDDPARFRTERLFVVDPIDGTRAFVAGERTWAHSLAVVEAGRPIAGVVFLPVREKLYVAEPGAGATLNGQALVASTRDDSKGASVLASRANFDATHWPGGVPEIDRHFRTSLAYRLSLIGEGRYDAMLTLRPTWEWDVAAGVLIAEAAGARVTDRHGNTPLFNSGKAQIDGVIAASPGVHMGLRASLDPGTAIGRLPPTL